MPVTAKPFWSASSLKLTRSASRSSTDSGFARARASRSSVLNFSAAKSPEMMPNPASSFFMQTGSILSSVAPISKDDQLDGIDGLEVGTKGGDAASIYAEQ